MQNLTNLTNAKAWANVQGNGDDTLITRLIAGASQAMLSYIGRQTLFKNSARMLVNGNGQTAMQLEQYPVQSVTAVTIDGVTVPAAGDSTSAGYQLEPWDGFTPNRPQILSLNGYAFNRLAGYYGTYPFGGSPYNDGFTRAPATPRSYLNVQIDYVVGYFTTDEPATIPATPGPYTLTTQNTLGTWGQDDGVKLASTGAAFVKVTGTPAAGQYAVSIFGTYTFNAADQGKAILISYSYIPADVEDAACQLVGERYSYKARIGQRSQSMGGQVTTSYAPRQFTDEVKEALKVYKRRALYTGGAQA